MRTEAQLIRFAEMHPDDKVANKAMEELRERFDPTYMWCVDCDGLVVKQSECCMNKKYDDGDILDLTSIL
jgi:hypothetical protein